MKRYDLNLLQALDALIAERSVSAAARRLGIGQPAMSAALARLRTMLDDPVMVRSGKGMELTPRARELAQPLRAALGQLVALVEPRTVFDPATATRRLRVSGGDYVGMTLLPGLATRLAAHAPLVDLRFRYLEKEAALACLDEDRLDLALMVLDDLPSRYDSDIVVEERFIGAARAGHPIVGGDVDLAAFAGFGHLLVTERGDETGRVDEVLAEAGLKRRVAITVPSAALVADILRNTDLVAAIPLRAARHIAHAGGIALFEPPADLGSWRMRMIWTKRNARDPAIGWLREVITAVAAEL